MKQIERGVNYFTIYKIINLINGKIYIGMHKTKDLNDNYMGSGRVINTAIKKYGRENFNKEILFIFDNPEEMRQKEAELVTDDFVKNPNTYNLMQGGLGGFDYINRHPNSHLWHQNAGKKTRTYIGAQVMKEKMNDSTFNQIIRQKISSGVKNSYLNRENPFKNKKHSVDSKIKMSQSKKGKQTISTLGKSWYTDGKTNIICFSTEVPEGFHKGRVCQ